MIKLKQLLFESTAPNIFIPRRMDDRVDRYIKQYIRDGGKGKLDISYMSLTKLPDVLKNIKIDGDFNCEGNHIESLENFPKSVGGAINLAWNKLKSLEGLNIEVANAGDYPGDSFNCKGNYLTDLKGGPKVVKGNYNCSENDLVSLKGAPEKIEGYFYCGHNKLTSFVGGPIFVAKDFYGSFNNLESFLKKINRAILDQFQQRLC